MRQNTIREEKQETFTEREREIRAIISRIVFVFSSNLSLLRKEAAGNNPVISRYTSTNRRAIVMNVRLSWFFYLSSLSLSLSLALS